MWIYSFHRFLNRTAFLDACDAAGFPRDHEGEPELPQSVSLRVIGPLIGRPTLMPNGTMVPGEVIDPRYHVNAAFYGSDVLPAFQASRVAPEQPSEVFAAPSAAPPPAAAVPATIAAWKGKWVLQQQGKLAAIEALIAAAGSAAKLAWEGAATWDRESTFIADFAAQAGLSGAQVDAWFIAAGQVDS